MTTKRDYPGLLEHARQVIGDLSDGEAYLDFVRRQPCLVSAKNSDPHHTKTRGAGGSDFLAVNLNRKYHDELGQIGMFRFEHKYGVDIDKTIRDLHTMYAKARKRVYGAKYLTRSEERKK